MFVASILLTTVSAVALATVPTYPFLVLFRFLQGLGAGALLPLLLGAVLRFTPLQQRVWGIAMYACITTLSPSVAEFDRGLVHRVSVVEGNLLAELRDRADRDRPDHDRAADRAIAT